MKVTLIITVYLTWITRVIFLFYYEKTCYKSTIKKKKKTITCKKNTNNEYYYLRCFFYDFIIFIVQVGNADKIFDRSIYVLFFKVDDALSIKKKKIKYLLLVCYRLLWIRSKPIFYIVKSDAFTFVIDASLRRTKIRWNNKFMMFNMYKYWVVFDLSTPLNPFAKYVLQAVYFK